MIVINMDDFNAWIQAFEHQATLFQCVMPMAMKFWQLPNSEIHCVIPLHMEVVIGLKFKGLSKEIMFTYNR
jgi:hypothetical protein